MDAAQFEPVADRTTLAYRSSPFKGEVGRGMGCFCIRIWDAVNYPIPTPALPLKGRAKFDSIST